MTHAAPGQRSQGPAADPGARRRARGPKTRRGCLAAVIMLLLGVLAVRIALGPAVTWYVNRTLDRDPRFDGKIEGVSIRLFRGAYAVHGVRLDKVVGGVAEPLITVDTLDLSVQWSALLSGRLVGEVAARGAELNFVDGGDPAQSQTGVDGPWLAVLTDLVPFRLNRVSVEDSAVYFRGRGGPVPVDVYVADLSVRVDDLTNVKHRITPMVTTARVSGRVMDQAALELNVRLDPTSYRPTFELDLRMLDLDVTAVNDLARAYGGLDFEGGRFDLTVEARAVSGQISGRVKPLFRNLEVFTFRGDVGKGDPLGAAWQLLVGVVGEVLENQPRDQLGTLVTFEADTTGLDLSVLQVVANVLRNAFVQAYLPKLRAEVDAGFTFAPAEILK